MTTQAGAPIGPQSMPTKTSSKASPQNSVRFWHRKKSSCWWPHRGGRIHNNEQDRTPLAQKCRVAGRSYGNRLAQWHPILGYDIRTIKVSRQTTSDDAVNRLRVRAHYDAF